MRYAGAKAHISYLGHSTFEIGPIQPEPARRVVGRTLRRLFTVPNLITPIRDAYHYRVYRLKAMLDKVSFLWGARFRSTTTSMSQDSMVLTLDGPRLIRRHHVLTSTYDRLTGQTSTTRHLDREEMVSETEDTGSMGIDLRIS